MRSPSKPILALIIVTLAAGVLPSSARTARPSVWSGRYSVRVDGQVARGWLAYRPGVAPRALLVIGHGCCGHVNQRSRVSWFARRNNAVVVAMDYRGPGHWDVWKGHRDTIAATRALKRRFRSIRRTVAWGASMGGEVTGMAVANAPGLFDFWVDTFGATDLTQEYVTLGTYSGSHRTATDLTRSWIRDETGGTPATAHAAYAARSPALMASKMRGLTHVYIIHGIGDPIVSYSQSRTLYQNLMRARVHTTLYTLTSRERGIQGPVLAGRRPYFDAPVGPASHSSLDYGPTLRLLHELLSNLRSKGRAGTREYLVDYSTGLRRQL